MKTFTTAAFFTLTFCFSSAIYADTFGSGANAFDIEFVTIGNPGNGADTTGDPNPAGSVAYEYRIGKFEISEDMVDKANTETTATSDPLNINHNGRGPNKPVTSVTWFEIAKFVNWLNTSTGHTPAYKFDVDGNFQLWTPGDTGYDANNLYRNSVSKYFLPSVDEWYKAAYYDPDFGVYYNYPTGSDAIPTAVPSGIAPGTMVYGQHPTVGPADIILAGGLSPYGTMAQGGNVFEWEETDYDLANDSTSSARDVRGGDWDNGSNNPLSSNRASPGNPASSNLNIGFRVASIVPEPTTCGLLLTATLLLAICRRRTQ